MDMEKDWIANAYEGMSRRQFLAQMTAAGAAIAGFAVASKAVAGEIITTPADGLAVADGKVRSAGFDLPIYLARPAKAGKYPVVIVLPEVWGMHEYIKDVVRRFAKRGFLAVTFEPYARDGGVLHLPDQAAISKVVNAVPDARMLADIEAVTAYAKTLARGAGGPDRRHGLLSRGPLCHAVRRPERGRQGGRALVRPDQTGQDGRD